MIARWAEDGRLQACLFCHRNTKFSCKIHKIGVLMLPNQLNAIPEPAHDELDSDDDGEGDDDVDKDGAGLPNLSPDYEPAPPANPIEEPRTPHKRDRSPSPSIPSGGERLPKRTKETESVLTPQGLPANPRRAPPPAPKTWLQARKISGGESKGKAREPSERPTQTANTLTSPEQPSLLTVPFAGPHPHPAPYPALGRFQTLEATASGLIPSVRASSSDPYYRAPSPTANELITSNRRSTKEAFDKARDSLQETLSVFEAAGATAEANARQQFRLLADADGGRSRAEAELGKEQEKSRTLKDRCTATENRNAELSEKNKQLASRVTLLETERETNQANHDAQIATLVAAKDAAEALHDTATNERKVAFAARDEAQREVAEAAEVVEQAIAEKEASEQEANELRARVSDLETQVDSLQSEANVIRWEQGEQREQPPAAPVEEPQLGVAGPSSS